MFDALAPKPADPLLAIIGMFAADTRESKIDLGVGVYRTSRGATPVMRAVKAAELKLQAEQDSKSYLGLVGDVEFVERLQQLAFGRDKDLFDRIVGIQTPGGSGALRLGTELIRASATSAQSMHQASRIWLGSPSWGNHAPILSAVGCEIANYDYFDVVNQTLQFDTMLEALSSADAGDVVLLQGCCHNPTGSDLSAQQWQSIARLCCEKGLVPFIDIAYQGLGEGLDADLASVNALLREVPEALVTVSCSKNFGLYRERTGALYLLCANQTEKAAAASNVMGLARVSWSMPPDHGAAVVRTILADTQLQTQWREELTEMQQRIQSTRNRLAAALGPQHSYIEAQKGMFSMLNLDPSVIAGLREKEGIYMAVDGRINVAGFGDDAIERFASSVRPLLDA